MRGRACKLDYQRIRACDRSSKVRSGPLVSCGSYYYPWVGGAMPVPPVVVRPGGLHSLRRVMRLW